MVLQKRIYQGKWKKWTLNIDWDWLGLLEQNQTTYLVQTVSEKVGIINSGEAWDFEQVISSFAGGSGRMEYPTAKQGVQGPTPREFLTIIYF